jgi:hypothetical protein
MKAKNVTLIILFLCSLSVYAKKIPGYIIGLDSIKKEVVFKVKMNFFSGEPNYVQLQTSIDYYDGDLLKSLKPENCQKIGFTLNDQKIELVSIKNKYKEETKLQGNRIFLRTKIEGAICLYYVYYMVYTTGASANGGTFTSSQMVNGWIMQNGSGKYLVFYDKVKKEDFLLAFPNFTDLVSSLEGKKLFYDDIEKLIKEYNKSETQSRKSENNF